MPRRPGKSFARYAAWGLLALVGVPLLLGAGGMAWIAALDRTSGNIVSSGRERAYLLHVPRSYDGTRSVPLVVSLHAGATWPAHQAHLTGWNRLADEEGFLVVYPAGSDLPGVPGASLLASKMWHTFAGGPELERDVRFLADLIDSLDVRYRIDPDRIYVNGMSNGGGMAFALSCALPGRIAAAGLVAAAQALPAGWCAPGRPVPVIAFHGTADPIAPYGGGPLGDRFNPVKPILPSIREFVSDWAARNRCAGPPAESRIAADVTRATYAGCEAGADVVLYTVEGGGHAWPGGKPPPAWRVGRTTRSVDATRTMWEFFGEHPLRDPSGAARPREGGGT